MRASTEKDWNALSNTEQDELLAQDEVLRARGDLVAAVGEATTLRAWDGTAPIRNEARAKRQAEVCEDSYRFGVGRAVSLEPIFVVSDVARAVAHYEQLGFSTSHHDEGYAFAHRNELTIHLGTRGRPWTAGPRIHLHARG
jgi:hypothetical protein